LAAPTIASARVLGSYVFANLFDMDPIPAPESSQPASEQEEAEQD